MSVLSTWKNRFWNAIDARIRKVLREEHCAHQPDMTLASVPPPGATSNIVERSLYYQRLDQVIICRHCGMLYYRGEETGA